MNKKTIFNIFVFISIFVIAIFSISSTKDVKVEKHFNYHYEKGIILKVNEEKIEPHDLYPSRSIGRQELDIQITSGEFDGKTFSITNFITAERNIILKEGQKAIFTIRENNGNLDVWIYNQKSEGWIYLLGGIFIGIIILLSGKRGLESILALAFTSTIIFFILIPMIFSGRDPIIWSIFLTAIITCVSMILIGDFDKKTFAAILGTLCGIIVAGGLAYTFGTLAKLSNIYLEYGDQLLYLSSKFPIRFNGLIFTGILIASLGAVMDVGMSIASATYELSKSTEHTQKDLFISAMNIGRDIMGTMTNTLILAFTGGALNLLLMIWGFRMGYTQVMNMPIFATEVIQALSGSIGIVLTVPFTAAISSYIYRK